MRLLLILTALMLAIAGGVWWKTTQAGAGDPDGALLTDPNLGIATFGAQEVAPPPATTGAGTPQDATAKKDLTLPAEAVLRNSHERATAGDPKEPQTAANETAPLPAATPPAPATPPTAPKEVAYVVKSGDTLYQIVKRAYGSAATELIADVAKANGLKDAGALKVGQKLKLPSLAGYPAPKSI
jgi:nucleoid-associated protein YgaU